MQGPNTEAYMLYIQWSEKLDETKARAFRARIFGKF